ncbi:hypothetical protein DVH05_006857 [Phytophthora capsici]|nr:hypothetical protein DVH05_006857 [Phytophthora capsici]
MRYMPKHVGEQQPLRPRVKQHTSHRSPSAWILHQQEPRQWQQRAFPQPLFNIQFWGTMRKSNPPQSPLLTPQTLTPVVAGGYSTKLWDQRAPKYSNNVMMRVCLFLFIVTFCEELAGYGVNQSLKNFFQKLGWSNKGSNSMKLTYDSLSQFACIAAAFIADQYLGKYKTILVASSISSIGFVLITIAAVPSVLDDQMLSKVLFCIGVFLGIALNQVGIRALLIPFGGDQFSPTSPPEQRASYFSINFWASNLGVAINYAVFPSLCLYGIGAIPADYGYVTVFAIGLALMLSIIVNLLSTRSRYINVPPTKSALGSVLHVIIRSARHSLNAKMGKLSNGSYTDLTWFMNRKLGVAPPDPRSRKTSSGSCCVSVRWGARRWARLRKYRAALLRGHPARACYVFAPRARSLPIFTEKPDQKHTKSSIKKSDQVRI